MIAILIVSDAHSEASAVNVMLATNLAETWVSPAAMSGPDDTVLQLVKLCGGFVPLGQEFVALRGEFADFVQPLKRPERVLQRLQDARGFVQVHQLATEEETMMTVRLVVPSPAVQLARIRSGFSLMLRMSLPPAVLNVRGLPSPRVSLRMFQVVPPSFEPSMLRTAPTPNV